MSIEVKQRLTEHQLGILNSEMEKHKKSTGLAYVLWFFGGSIGIHKFYIGNIKAGILYLILGIFGWTSMFTGGLLAMESNYETGGGASMFGLIALVVLGVMVFIDLFTLSKQIRKKYEEAENNLINELLKEKEAITN